jgi:hypothetical protein
VFLPNKGAAIDFLLRFGRFPSYGGKSGITGQDFIYANNGLMARDIDSLKFYCKSVLQRPLLRI